MTEPLRLAFRLAGTGTGPSLVVIQQLDSKELWQPVVDRLAGERQVLCVDLPGFGESPSLPGGERSTIGVLSDVLATWVNLVGLERPDIVGCSVGGAVALELARAGAVRSATAIAPVGMWSRSEAAYTARSVGAARKAARLIGPFAALVVGNRAGRRLAFSQIAARPDRIPAPAAVAALRNMARSPGVEATRRELCDYRVEGFDAGVPLAIAWGDQDRLTPPRQARTAIERLPNASHFTLTGCGHVPMFDDPDQVAAVVLAESPPDPRPSHPIRQGR